MVNKDENISELPCRTAVQVAADPQTKPSKVANNRPGWAAIVHTYHCHSLLSLGLKVHSFSFQIQSWLKQIAKPLLLGTC